MQAPFLRWIGAVVVLGLALALVGSSCQSERRIRKAQTAVARADSLRVDAESNLRAALSALEANKRDVHIIRKTDTLLQERVKVLLAEPVPDTCAKFVIPLRLLVDDQQLQIGKWRGAWEHLSAATDSVLGVVTTLKESNRSLSDAVRLLQPRRYDLLGRLLHPTLKPALFVGVCATGRPCVGVGAALTF